MVGSWRPSRYVRVIGTVRCRVTITNGDSLRDFHGRGGTQTFDTPASINCWRRLDCDA